MVNIFREYNRQTVVLRISPGSESDRDVPGIVGGLGSDLWFDISRAEDTHNEDGSSTNESLVSL